jgi:hypothetical protein
LSFAGGDPVGLGFYRLPAAAKAGRPFRRSAVNRKAELSGDRRQRVSVRGMQPLGAAVEWKPRGCDRLNSAADTVARFDHQDRNRTRLVEAPGRADPRRAGTDYGDIHM